MKLNPCVFLALCTAASAFHVHADEACTADDDCLQSWEYCKVDSEMLTEPDIQQTGICTHKSIFSGVNGIEIVGLFMTFLIIFFSNFCSSGDV